MTDDLPEPAGAPHPIVAYTANLEKVNAALRAALEQAVKTCSRCRGNGRLFGEIIYDIPIEATIVSAVMTYGDGRSEPIELTACPQCTPWRELLKP